MEGPRKKTPEEIQRELEELGGESETPSIEEIVRGEVLNYLEEKGITAVEAQNRFDELLLRVNRKEHINLIKKVLQELVEKELAEKRRIGLSDERLKNL